MRALVFAVALSLLAGAPRLEAAQLPAEVGEAARIPGVPFEELAQKASAAASAGRLDEAVRFYRAGLVLNPLWADGWWRLALLHFDAERFAAARDALRRLVRLEAEDGPSWALLGLSEYRLRELEPALASLTRAVALGVPQDQPLGREALHHLALLLVRSGQFAASAGHLARLVLLQADDPELVLVCGLMALRMPRLPAEIPAGERDLVMTAGRAAHAAFAYREDEARQRFEELVTRFPKTRGTHYAYGLYLTRHASSAALPMLQQELALFPDHAEAQLEAAFAILDRGEAKEALAPARAAARLQPESPAAHLVLGRALLANGAVAEAVGELERAEALNPGVRDVYLALAQAYAKAGRVTDVERARAKLVELEAQRGSH